MKNMKRISTISYPYEITEENGLTVLRFYPKDPDAKYPDSSVLVLKLNAKDKQTLVKQLS
jgi:hypothetical protein